MQFGTIEPLSKFDYIVEGGAKILETAEKVNNSSIFRKI